MSFDIVNPEKNQKYSLHDILIYKLKRIYPHHFSSTSKRSLRKKAESFIIKDRVLYYCGPRKSTHNVNVTRENLKECILTEADVIEHIKRVSGYNERNANGRCEVRCDWVYRQISSKYYYLGLHRTVRDFYQTHIYDSTNDLGILVSSGDSNQDLDGQDPDGQDVIGEDEEDGEDCDLLDTEDDLTLDTGLDFSYFWKKVEICVVSTGGRGPRRHLYVCVDEFSSWVEAEVYAAHNLTNLVHFIFRLIARFGVMKQVLLYESEDNATRLNEAFSGSLQDARVPGIEFHSETDHDKCSDQIKLVKARLAEFISNHPAKWHKYIDMFLLPFRVSRPHTADYSPAYLTYGREPVLPSCISQCSEKAALCEPHFTADMFEESLTAIMTALDECTNASTQISRSTSHATGIVEIDEGGDEGDDEGEGGGDGGGSGQDGEGDELGDDDDDDDIVNKSIYEVAEKKYEGKKRIKRICHPYGNLLECVRHYLTTATYLPNYNEDMKKNVRLAAMKFLMSDDKLYRIAKNKLLLEVIIHEKDRVQILYACHVRRGEHLPFKVCHQRLSERFYWKGIFCDLCHFIRACRGCNETPNLPVPSIQTFTMPLTPDKSSQSTHQSSASRLKPSRSRRREMTYIQDDDVDSKYDVLRGYLEYKTFPDGYTIKEKQTLVSTAQAYKLISGDLYYLPPGERTATPRRMLFSQAARRAAMESCHIIDGEHQSGEMTFERVMKFYYWSELTTDVTDYILACDHCHNHQKKVASLNSSDLPMPNENTIDVFVSVEASQLNEVSASDDIDLLPFTNDHAQHGVTRPPPRGAPALKSNIYNDLRLAKFTKIFENTEFLKNDAINEGVFEGPLKYQTPDIVQVLPARLLGGRPRKYPKLEETVSKSDAQTGVELLSRAVDLKEGSAVTVTGSPGEDLAGGCDVLLTTTDSTPAGVLAGSMCLDAVHTTSVAVNTDQRLLEGGVDDQGGIGEETVTMMFIESTAEDVGQGGVLVPQVRRRRRTYKHTCCVCQRQFTRIDQYHKHMVAHKDYRPFTCTTCHKAFTSRKSLLVHHQTSHDPDAGKNILCELCGKTFLSSYLLKRHVSVVHDKCYFCADCDKIFASKASHEKHMAGHSGGSDCVCHVCFTPLPSQAHLDQHLLVHITDGSIHQDHSVEGMIVVAAAPDHPDQTMEIVINTDADIPAQYIEMLQQQKQQQAEPQDEQLHGEDNEPEVEQLTMEITEELTSQLLSGCNVLVDAHGVQYQVICAEDE